MNNNNSKHTPIITLEEIARRKAEKREEVLKAKTQITETLRELFVPEENKGGIEGIMQHVNTGIAVYDGVMTGIKIMRKVRSYFTKKKKELETSLAQAEKEYKRNKTLFEKKVISEEEYDKYYYQYQTQQNELASLTQSQLSTWQADLNSYRNSRNEMSTSLKQEVKDQDMYIVRSPVDGTLDQFSGIYRGSSIQAGQSLAVISPDSTLCLEVYVTPRNIGFMNIGMPVNIQVESFNYNEWGTLPGKVKEISSDFLTDNQGNSFYKVKCEMEQDYLTLKNGQIGKLKKGMTASAHFMVTRRSLFDLLYQKIDDWANPRQYAANEMIASVKAPVIQR